MSIPIWSNAPSTPGKGMFWRSFKGAGAVWSCAVHGMAEMVRTAKTTASMAHSFFMFSSLAATDLTAGARRPGLLLLACHEQEPVHKNDSAAAPRRVCRRRGRGGPDRE